MSTFWYDLVHLDRLCVIDTGDLSYSDPTTTITLPLADDSLDTAILGPGYGTAAGTVLNLASNTAGTATITSSGNDYSTAQMVVGRGFTFSMELTRPYYTGSGGTVDFDSRLLIREISVALHRTAYATVRTSLNNRAPRSKNFDVNDMSERAMVSAYFNGFADQMQVFLENNQPKPSTFSAVQFIAHHYPRSG